MQLIPIRNTLKSMQLMSLTFTHAVASAEASVLMLGKASKSYSKSLSSSCKPILTSLEVLIESFSFC